MAEVLAIPLLYDAVEARFTADATPCALAFGRKARTEQVTGPRIVMAYGDPAGVAGEIGPAKQVGRNPRPLGTFAEIFHVIVSGAGSATDPTNERAAYTATRLLFDAWYRAAFLYAGPQLVFVGAQWLIDRVTARFATSFIATFSLEAMIPDAALGLVDFTARGLLTSTMLDHDETVETAPAPATVDVAARTPITLSGLQTVDGALLEADDRVLVVAQASAAANGVYVAAAGAWSRAVDTLTSEMLIRATAGTTGPALYQLTTTGTITPDVTAQTWARITPE